VGEGKLAVAGHDEFPAELQDVLAGVGLAGPPAAGHPAEVVGQHARAEEHPPAPPPQAEGAVSRPPRVAKEREGPRLQAQPGREHFRLALGDRDQFGPEGVEFAEAALHLAEVRPARDSGQVAEEDDDTGPTHRGR
jgi:hypothetical protein